MKTAYMFAGQGSQKVGMGAGLLDTCPSCRALVQEAEDILGLPLGQLMLRGQETELMSTEVAQPAILTLSLAQAAHLRGRGEEPDAVIGHSLGQYSALVFGGAIAFGDAVRLVSRRGQLMQAAVPPGRGAMATVMGCVREEVADVCRRVAPIGSVQIACHNAPGQTVISGECLAVESAINYLSDRGATTIELPVSAPFHCRLLEPMMSEFAALIECVSISDPYLPVIDNVTARPLSNASEIRRSLISQVMAPVLFEESLRYLMDDGYGRFLQCGPGRSLLNFVKRFGRTVQLDSVESMLQETTYQKGAWLHAEFEFVC